MKYRTILSLLVCILLLGSCHQKSSSTEKMSSEQMLQLLDAKISKNQKDADLYYQRGRLLLQMGRVNEAIRDASKAIELKDKKVDYYLLLGDAQFATGNVEKSYDALHKALDLDSDNSEAQLKMGEIAYYSRDFDRAMESLTKVTAKDPNNRTALFMKSFIYKETGDTANAITLLRKVCDIYPDYAPAFEELGIIYSSRHLPVALEYFNTALQLDPSNTNTLYAMAMYYQDEKNYEQAENIYKQMLDINSNSVDAWHNRGYIQLFVYGDYPLAIEYFTQALMIDPNSLESLTNRGCAYEMNGNAEAAADDFRAALQIQQGYAPAVEGLKRLGK